ncbi:mitochondrial protein Pet127-domain-containing protein [Cunninghamella echinulata]|nr:mitochondrial protein Pet127-domain-containing protein [Cunninghamella echinulata]
MWLIGKSTNHVHILPIPRSFSPVTYRFYSTVTSFDINNNKSNKNNLTPICKEQQQSQPQQKDTSSSSTSTKKRKAKANRKGRKNKSAILRVLKQHNKVHNTGSPIKSFTTSFRSNAIEPTLLDQYKKDIDNSWNELKTSNAYERIYPDKSIPVATLAHGLERTLFKSGVHLLRDFRSKKFLFSPYLESITQPDQFDYNAIQPYKTSSQDNLLIKMAEKNHAKFVGSTSSISGVLSHIYYQVSNHRPVDISFLTETFATFPSGYTRGARAPKTIYLRRKTGTVYAIDVDKSFDGEDTILSHLGKSMEKLLTMEPNEYERYLKENSSVVTEEERNAPEAFAYGKIDKLVLRSQLDCYHKLLPRRTFDLKTRATMPIRLDIPHYQDYYKYTLEQHHGKFYSFEREYYDMMRSAFLKYNFQVRIGHMDGIMVTYHNTNTIFGFQYISRHEMDARLFGTTKMGDEAFNHCLTLIQEIFNKAISRYPGKTLRLSFDASDRGSNFMKIYVEPVTKEQEEKEEQQQGKEKEGVEATYEPLSEDLTLFELSTQSYINDQLVEGPVSVNRESTRWDLFYKLETSALPQKQIINMYKRLREYQATVFLPTSDESPSFLEKFKLDRNEHQHRQKKTKKNKNKTEEKKEKDSKIKMEVEVGENEEEKDMKKTLDITTSSSSS